MDLRLTTQRDGQRQCNVGETGSDEDDLDGSRGDEVEVESVVEAQDLKLQYPYIHQAGIRRCRSSSRRRGRARGCQTGTGRTYAPRVGVPRCEFPLGTVYQDPFIMVRQRQGFIGRHVHISAGIVCDLDDGGVDGPECGELLCLCAWQCQLGLLGGGGCNC